MHRLLHVILKALRMMERGSDDGEQGLLVLRDLSADTTTSDILISAGAIEAIFIMTRSETTAVKQFACETVCNLTMGSNSMKNALVSLGIVEIITSETSIENKVLLYALSLLTECSDIATMRQIISGGSVVHFLRFIRSGVGEEEGLAMCGLKNIIMFGDGDGVEEFRHDVVMAGSVAALVERSQSNRFHQKHFALHILAELAYTCRKGNLLKIFED